MINHIKHAKSAFDPSPPAMKRAQGRLRRCGDETGSARVQTHVGLDRPPDRAAISERARVFQPVRDGERKGDLRCKQSGTAAALQGRPRRRPGRKPLLSGTAFWTMASGAARGPRGRQSRRGGGRSRKPPSPPCPETSARNRSPDTLFPENSRSVLADTAELETSLAKIDSDHASLVHVDAPLFHGWRIAPSRHFRMPPEGASSPPLWGPLRKHPSGWLRIPNSSRESRLPAGKPRKGFRHRFTACLADLEQNSRLYKCNHATPTSLHGN